jgi:hypothetical protein
MSKRADIILEAFDNTLNKLIEATIGHMQNNDDNIAEAIDSLAGLVMVLQKHHATGVIVAAVSLMETSKEDDLGITPQMIREMVTEAEQMFSSNLHHMLAQACKSAGLDNPFDLNAKLREEIENDT